jgi:glucose/mannose transport system substrate-binding protein
MEAMAQGDKRMTTSDTTRHAPVASRRRALAIGCGLPLALLAGSARSQGAGAPLQVLHWWSSASERNAIQVLANRLQAENAGWQVAIIPGGSGVGASIVLKSRVLAGDAPHVAQLNGAVTLGEWDELGLLQDIDAVAQAGKWESLLHPTVMAVVQPRGPHGHVVAAPLGIHRINALFYNRALMTRFGLVPPRTWDEFERAAARLQRAGVPALAQSAEPWQVGTLFENLVLAEGAGFYRDLFVRRDARAYMDRRLGSALSRLRGLKAWMASPHQERSWADSTRQLAEGGAAMMVMGDFVKGELNALGQGVDTTFGCAAAPGTAGLFLYDVDTLAMLAGDANSRRWQEKLAQTAVLGAVQGDYNQIKGSIPVLRQPDLARMDSWSRASWQLFARGPSVQVPSLTHRMATDEMTRDAMIAAVHRFFVDDAHPIATIQQRLGFIAASTNRK